MDERDFDAAAAGWLTYEARMQSAFAPLNELMVDEARVGPGDRVLDLCTGLGNPAFLVAERVGAGGAVDAVDVSPAMLTYAKQRAERERVAQIRFVQADAQTFAGERPYDAIVCRLGLMFLDDVDGALARYRAQLRPGGRFVAAVWSRPERVPFISFPIGFARSRFPLPPGDGPTPFSLSDPEELRRRVERAGFVDVTARTLELTISLPSAEAYVEQVTAMMAPLMKMLAQRDETERTQFRRALAEAAAQRFSRPDGTLSFVNEALVVTAGA